MPDSKIEKWQRWIETRIENEVLTMHLHRHAWHEVGKVLDAHGELPDSYFWEFQRDLYGAAQVLAIRRQADRDPRVVNLARLLVELEADADRVTRTFFLDLYGGDEFQANRDFGRLVGVAISSTPASRPVT